jgi:hypothetical protein
LRQFKKANKSAGRKVITMPNKQHPAIIAIVLLVGLPIAIWLVVLLVGVISSIGEWFGYSVTQ